LGGFDFKGLILHLLRFAKNDLTGRLLDLEGHCEWSEEEFRVFQEGRGTFLDDG
jgi:hypothetical protein